jgi:predicted  nucleic acid-binding Zn-ribbon protein
MSQVLELLTLQSLDDELAGLHGALAEAERRLQGDPELLDARRVLSQEEADLDALRKQQRHVEYEVEAFNSRIARDEGRLYDGSIKNPKELSSLEHEVGLQKAARGKLEDELIELLEATESAEQAREAAFVLVRHLEERWERQQKELTQEAHRLQDAIVRADEKRRAQQDGIPPRALQLYEDLRRRKGGMAVARITGSSCSGCRVSIPDAVRRRVMSPIELAQCPNCERILALG